ncbi:MAG TPA: TerC family protein [Vicinamibacteria bacterium]|jgi:predicted tellurium resistance membrane protein TerC
MDWLTDPNAWLGLLTLTALEIVLGIDNVIFISILAGKLGPVEAERARKLGLLLAMVARVALLFSISWLTRLTAPLFSVAGQEISGRDLVLIAGGLFLLAKSTYEIHDKLEGGQGHAVKKVAPSLASVLVQIMLLDLVFSLDSVITAVGMVDELSVMVIAVVVAVGFMLVFSGAIARFVNEHPTIKILALSFLILIGVLLVAEGFEQHIPKGYVYFAMAFSVGVEMLNMRMRKAAEPVHLHSRYEGQA